MPLRVADEKELTEFDERLYDPAFFCRNILGLEITWFHDEWLRMAKSKRNVCIQAPRGHGKTEVLIIGFTLYSLYTAIMDIHYKKRERPFECAIISKSMPQSTDVLRRLRYKVMDIPLLRNYMSVGRGKVWSSSKLSFTGRHMIYCVPYGDQVRGKHVDLVTIDEAGTFEDKDIFKYAITPIVQKWNGKIVTIGTPTSQVDLLNELFNNAEFASKKYQAFTDRALSKPLWATEFNKKKLDTIRETIGTLAFSREYMCEPIGEEDRIFPYQLIEKGFLNGEGWVREKRSNDLTYWIGADFAMSATAQADYSAFVVIEKSLDGSCRICEIYRRKGKSFEEQMSILRDMHDRYGPVNCLIDARTFGETFFQRMREDGLRVEAYKLTRESKESLIMHLRNQFEKARVLIPKSKDTKTDVDVLITELLSFSATLTPAKQITYEGLGEHDDCVIALALAIFVATRFVYGQIRLKRSAYARVE